MPCEGNAFACTEPSFIDKNSSGYGRAEALQLLFLQTGPCSLQGPAPDPEPPVQAPGVPMNDNSNLSEEDS